MTTLNDYQIKKETETKFLNKISQLVENNRFEEATKEKVKSAIGNAVNAIIENRKEVYKDLIDYDATELVHEPKDELLSTEKNKSADDTRYVAHDCIELAVSLKAANSYPIVSIMDETTLKKYAPTKSFVKNQIVLIESLNKVISALTEAETEEKKTDISDGDDGNVEEISPVDDEVNNGNTEKSYSKTVEGNEDVDKAPEEKSKKKKTLLDKIKGK